MSHAVTALLLIKLDCHAGQWLPVAMLASLLHLRADLVCQHLEPLAANRSVRVHRGADHQIEAAMAPVPGAALEPEPGLDPAPASASRYGARSAARPLPHHPSDWGALGRGSCASAGCFEPPMSLPIAAPAAQPLTTP